MPININDDIKVNAPKLIDGRSTKLVNNISTPFDNTAEALQSMSSNRFLSQTALVRSLVIDTSVAEYFDPDTTIMVVPTAADDYELKAAGRINVALNTIYGTAGKFIIYRDNVKPSLTGKFIINFGLTSLDTSVWVNNGEPYSYSITRVDRVMSFRGQLPISELFGAVYFLDTYCDVRYYLPSTLFTSTSKASKIEIPKVINITTIPFVSRVYSTGILSSPAWTGVDTVTALGLIRRDYESHQHSFGTRFASQYYFDNYPLIFPLYNGVRYFPSSPTDQNWQPDFAEPTLIDASVYAAIAYFTANPTISYMSFSVMDSDNYSTEGAIGLFLQNYASDDWSQIQGYTDANVNYLNALCARLVIDLPNAGITRPVSIIYISYGRVRRLPSVTLHPMLLPIRVVQLSLYNTPDQGGGGGTVDQWKVYTNRTGDHDWAEGLGFLYPRIYTSMVQDYLLHCESIGMPVELGHFELYPNWGMDGPKIFFISKLLWNPHVNVDDMLKQFCDDMFGAASTTMFQYWKTLEQLNTLMVNSGDRSIGYYVYQMRLNAPEYVLLAQARTFINTALNFNLTADQTSRIQLFSVALKCAELFFNYTNNETVYNSTVTDLTTFLDTYIKGDIRMLYMSMDGPFDNEMTTIISQITTGRKTL